VKWEKRKDARQGKKGSLEIVDKRYIRNYTLLVGGINFLWD
jgi:hypothetical protein